jgi:hypothetical protein
VNAALLECIRCRETVKVLDDVAQGDCLYRVAPGYQRDRIAMKPGVPRYFPNPNVDNPFSDVTTGDHFVPNVFRASKIHQTHIVALFPATRRFFADVAMPIRNDVASS